MALHSASGRQWRRFPQGPRRTAAVAAWFQSLYESPDPVPILVGGGAVELYTGGAYVTGDLDFVGAVPPQVARALREAGFHKEGRHWIDEAGEIFIELPGSQLEPDERIARVRVEGVSVVVIGPEDALIDRLAAWQFWNSAIDGANAFLLCRAQRGRLDQRRLSALANSRRVSKALQALRRFTHRMAGRSVPREELELWARQRL